MKNKFPRSAAAVPQPSRLLLWGIGLGSFIAGAAAGLWLGNVREPSRDEPREIRASGYKFISPLLECEMFRDGIPEIRLFRARVERLVNGIIRRGDATHVSIYFRDLNNGPWFGINEQEGFAPASLLKVPVMLAYLKWEEGMAGLLARKLPVVSGGQTMLQLIGPGRQVKAGDILSIRELIERMIVFSDNQATVTLLTYLPPQRLNSVYTDLGLAVPDVNVQETVVRVKDYASFFRILYNASYVSPEASERALGLLSKVEFHRGLTAGVPPGIAVAHKFGERELGDGLVQLHDCGIIYASSPYLLCVMSRGRNLDVLARVLRDVSSEVYKSARLPK